MGRSAVVLMSAHASAEVAAEARALGAFDVLPKPFDLEGCERTSQLARGAAGRWITSIEDLCDD